MKFAFCLWSMLVMFLFSDIARAADLPTCAVMTFEAKNGMSKEETAVLADRFESELIQLKQFKMVSRANLTKVLQTQKLSMECSGTECAVEAGKIASIQYIAFGSIGKVGSTFSLVVNLVNVETAVIEKTSAYSQKGDVDDLLVSGLAACARKLMGVDATPLAPAVAAATVPAVSSPKHAGETMSVDLGGGEKLELVRVEPGSFVMGSDEDGDEKPAHQVTLPQGYWIGKNEVTQAQWERVMGNNPSKEANPRNPVDQVSWADCQQFIQKLNGISGSTVQGSRFRLPTEAEWEYACRAGTVGHFFFADGLMALRQYAWYRPASGGRVQAAGGLKPNPWGLYDMLGNVNEWCDDWYEAYPGAGGRNAFMGQTMRVLRGGSCMDSSLRLSCSGRTCGAPDERTAGIGLRVVCAAK